MKIWVVVVIIALLLVVYVISARFYLNRYSDIKNTKKGLQRVGRIIIDVGLWPAEEPLPEHVEDK